MFMADKLDFSEFRFLSIYDERLKNVYGNKNFTEVQANFTMHIYIAVSWNTFFRSTFLHSSNPTYKEMHLTSQGHYVNELPRLHMQQKLCITLMGQPNTCHCTRGIVKLHALTPCHPNRAGRSAVMVASNSSDVARARVGLYVLVMVCLYVCAIGCVLIFQLKTEMGRAFGETMRTPLTVDVCLAVACRITGVLDMVVASVWRSAPASRAPKQLPMVEA